MSPRPYRGAEAPCHLPLLDSGEDRLDKGRCPTAEAGPSRTAKVLPASWCGVFLGPDADRHQGLHRENVATRGLLARCDAVGDGVADYSAKHREHGVTVQVVTAPDGTLLWLSPAARPGERPRRRSCARNP